MDPRQFLQIKDRAADRLLALPGVHIVGVGAKEVAGKATGQPAIKIGVVQKKPLSALPPAERIPDQIEGAPTDVIQAPRQRMLQDVPGILVSEAERRDGDTRRYRPVRGGVRIVRKDRDGGGTLGVLCGVVGDTTRVFGLTNHHVIYQQDTDTPNGEKVGQPTGKDSCCKSSSDIIGRVHEAVVNDHVDVALLQLDGGTQYLREIEEIGVVRGSALLTFADICTQEYALRKRGFRTGLTGGIVAIGTAICDVEMAGGGTRRVSDLLMVLANHLEEDISSDTIFGYFGDSGSAVVNDLDEVVGLLVTAGRLLGVGLNGVIPIGNIFDAFATRLPQSSQLQLEVLSGATPGQVFTVPRLAVEEAAAGAAPVADEDLPVRPIEEDARRTRLGAWYADLYLRHRDEVERLVNGNRHVAAVWHRRGGAGLMQSLARLLRDPARRVPPVIDGRSLTACIEEFARALLRFGSEPLKQDLTAARPTLPDIGGLTYDQMMDALAAADRSFASAG